MGVGAVEQLGAPPQHAHAHGAERLVRGEREEVRPELIDVDGHVRHGLRGVDHHVRAPFACAAADSLAMGFSTPRTLDT